MTISVDYIKKNFDYDPVTGLILNKVTGRQVGYLENINQSAYMRVSVRVGGKIVRLQSAHIAYVLTTGEELPSNLVVTYLNNDPTDISWDNLVFSHKSVVSKEAVRQPKPSYVATNDPNVFRGEHNGIYVVRRWEVDSNGRQVGTSTLAVLRFDNFEDACCAAEEWRQTVST